MASSKEQALSLDFVRDVLDYNQENGLFTWRENLGTRARSGEDVAHHVHESGYVLIGLKGKQYAAHRLAWFWVYGSWPEPYLDHKNRIKHDNRLSNLRLATKSQNGINRVWRRPAKHGRGIFVQRGKNYVRLRRDGQLLKFGPFDTIEEAKAVYNFESLRFDAEFQPLKNSKPYP